MMLEKTIIQKKIGNDKHSASYSYENAIVYGTKSSDDIICYRLYTRFQLKSINIL